MSATLEQAPSGALPYYARPSEKHDYVWKGVELPRVTHILNTIGSEHLRAWYAKMAAEDCANILVRAESGFISMDQAHEDIRNWKERMVAPIKYRDHKGRIGSIVHHFLYEHALGISLSNLPAWITATIDSLQLVKREESNDDYASTLARASEPYILRVQDWLKKFEPEWEAIGQEAVVVNETFGYAGTCDAIATFTKSKWPKDHPWKWEKDSVRLLVDFKTSKSIKDTYWWQIEAYRNADFIGLIQDGSEHEVPITDGSIILHIKPDSPVGMLTSPPNEEIFEAFCSLIHVFNVLEKKPSTTRIKQLAKSRAGSNKKRSEGPRECPF